MTTIPNPEPATLPGAPVPVVLVDDHHMFRAGVRASLDGRVDIVGEADRVDGAVEAIRALRPPVVLLDVHLPGGNGGGGAEVITRCSDLLGSTRFLALSVSDAAEDVVAVIRAGARGYVTKAISGPDLAGAVVQVASRRSCGSSRAATPTARSPRSSSSRSRRSRPTCRRCCASSSSPRATSSRGGLRPGASSEPVGPLRGHATNREIWAY